MTAAQLIGATIVSLPFVALFFAMVKDIGLGETVWIYVSTLGVCGMFLAGILLLCS